MTREEAHKYVLDNCGYVHKEFIEQIFNDHEAQIKAKNEEVERLKKEDKKTIGGLGGLIAENMREAKKARSIVAMLFWESKRYTRIGLTLNSNSMYRAFNRAYKMLKDNK